MVWHFKCRDYMDETARSWTGVLDILKAGDPCEAVVVAEGSQFHVIVGNHAYGRYLCVPDWNVGTELAGTDDVFWNQEHLMDYTRLKRVDAISLACAVQCIGRNNI